MDISQRKEQFSKAFVRAVSSVAGFATSEPSVDDDSVDLTISRRGGSGSILSPRLDVQLKCTELRELTDTSLKFDLKVKNYEDLRPENVAVPRILVVMTVPKDLGDWMDFTEEEITLRYSGYWLSLRGEEPTEKKKTVRVELPREQTFDVAGLTEMMGRIGEGGLP